MRTKILVFKMLGDFLEFYNKAHILVHGCLHLSFMSRPSLIISPPPPPPPIKRRLCINSDSEYFIKTCFMKTYSCKLQVTSVTVTSHSSHHDKTVKHLSDCVVAISKISSEVS